MDQQRDTFHRDLRKEASPIYALKSDPRFSYSLYIPPGLSASSPVVTIIHGNMRNLIKHRDAFIDFARWNDCVILAPLFPYGVLGDDNKDGFKFILEGDIRYDHLLKEMFAETVQRCRLTATTFGLQGFAGGAQFAHRYAILQPESLWGVSIAAPGSVTLLDPNKKWWLGIADIQEVLGMSVNFEALRKLPVHMVVGTADVDKGTDRTSMAWMEGGRDAGETALERLRSLQASFEEAGINVEFSMVPGKGHQLFDLMEPSKDFFVQQLKKSGLR